MKIKNIGKIQPRIINTGETQPKVDPILVAKALGAQYVGYVDANPHNLPLPKPVQEQLLKITLSANEKTDKEKELELAIV
ncbi:MAG: hypothetical protein FD167_1271 [bacterium]|nr:MAG: hypothetical protein FD167_1271 [bacterium]